MTEKVSVSPQRGQTLLSGAGRTLSATTAYGTSVGREGEMHNFNDLDSTASFGVKTPRSNRQVTMLLVRNTSGIALGAKRLVRWEAGYRGKRVDGYAATTSDSAVAGVVDEFIGSAGVPNHDLFWLAVKGPHLVSTAYTEVADTSENDRMDSLTAAGTTNTTAAGRVRPVIATSSVTVAVASLNSQIGVAMSAVSSSSTAGNLLIDLNLPVF